MDDLALMATLDDSSTLYVTALDSEAYAEHVDGDLGGVDGYFVIRETDTTFEVLAKAPSRAAAGDLFDLIVARRRAHP